MQSPLEYPQMWRKNQEVSIHHMQIFLFLYESFSVFYYHNVIYTAKPTKSDLVGFITALFFIRRFLIS